MGLREKNTIIAQKKLNAIATTAKSRIIDLGGNWTTDNGKPIIKNGPLYRYHYGIRAQIGGLAVAHNESAGVITIEIKTSDSLNTDTLTPDSTLKSPATIATFTFAGTDLKDMTDTELLRTEVPQNAKRYLQAEVSGTNFTNATDFLAEFLPMPLV